MNVSVPIAAVMLDLGFPASAVKSVPILARTAGLLAHLAEEREQPLGFLMAGAAEDAVEYEPRRLMLEPAVESRPWAEQLALDDASYREQLAYLFERSAFYRAKLAAAGLGTAEEAGGLDEIGALPFTEKRELRESVTPENPIGTHLCAAPRGDRPHLLDERNHRDAELHPAHGRRPRQLADGLVAQLRGLGISAGQRIVSTYNAGPFVAGAALQSFDRLGLCHIPVGTGNTERLMPAIELLQPGRRRAHAVVRGLSRRVGGRARAGPRGSSVQRVLVAGEPGGGEPAFRSSSRRAGAEGD